MEEQDASESEGEAGGAKVVFLQNGRTEAEYSADVLADGESLVADIASGKCKGFVACAFDGSGHFRILISGPIPMLTAIGGAEMIQEELKLALRQRREE